MKHIPLSQGKFAIVDDEDYDYLMQWKWYANKMGNTWYATNYNKGGMHRLIMKYPKGLQVDHINHNGLDNRRCNLRICTKQQNEWNRLPNCNAASPYRGVQKMRGKWAANIRFNGKLIYLGVFASDTEAAKVWDAKAKELFGEYAYLNFPNDIEKEAV